MNNTHWSRSGDTFYPSEISNNIGRNLPTGIYHTRFDGKNGTYFLVRIADEFTFSYKVYGIEDDFIKRVVRTYGHTVGNLGILLTGVKGTGKTVTAEILCNTLNKPVIVVTQVKDQLSEFISSIPCDCTIFIDEYDKLFKDSEDEVNDDTMLSIMDGATSNESRKTFILTTNELWINKNMMERPGRIRYLKEFNDLSLPLIKSIVSDVLVNKDRFDEIVEFVSHLNMITVDIVKAITEEVNIHNEPPSAFEDVFNVKPLEKKFEVYMEDEGGWEKIDETTFQSKPKKGGSFIIQEGMHYEGIVHEVISETEFRIKKGKEIKRYRLEEMRRTHAAFIPPLYLTV